MELPTQSQWNSSNDMNCPFPEYKIGMHPNSQASLKQNQKSNEPPLSRIYPSINILREKGGTNVFHSLWSIMKIGHYSSEFSFLC